MQELVQQAFAKINLSLDVLSRRADGYHEVSMVMQQIGLFDTVVLSPTGEKGEVVLKSDSTEIPLDERNLAYRAAKLIRERYAIAEGVEIYIGKKIPIAGGLAGGSTDAAAVLTLMNQAFDLSLSKQELMALGLELGADVPFCLFGHSALAEGIGEKLKEIKGLSDCKILVVNPGVAISTKMIYEEMDHFSERKTVDNISLISHLEQGDWEGACPHMVNNMQPVAAKQCPQIPEIIKKLKQCGAKHAMMSGSGSTCFGLFEPDVDLEPIAGSFPEYFTAVTAPKTEEES